MQIFCAVAWCFVNMVIFKILKLKIEGRRKTAPQTYKTPIKILPFPGLA